MTSKSAVETTDSPSIRSLIPARIDRLPWSKFHNRLVIALGIAWILDGLEITIASNVGPDLTLPGHCQHSTIRRPATGSRTLSVLSHYVQDSGISRRVDDDRAIEHCCYQCPIR